MKQFQLAKSRSLTSFVNLLADFTLTSQLLKRKHMTYIFNYKGGKQIEGEKKYLTMCC